MKKMLIASLCFLAWTVALLLNAYSWTIAAYLNMSYDMMMRWSLWPVIVLSGVAVTTCLTIFCLGVYTGAVPDAEFRRITVDYTVELARVLRASSPAAAFSFLSGNGADPTGRSRLAFARYKGEAEQALSAAGFPHLYIFRPAYIYPVRPRREPNVSYRVLRAIYPAFRMLFPNQVIPSDNLGRAMVDAAIWGAGEGRTVVLENRDIRRLAPHHGQMLRY